MASHASGTSEDRIVCDTTQLTFKHLDQICVHETMVGYVELAMTTNGFGIICSTFAQSNCPKRTGRLYNNRNSVAEQIDTVFFTGGASQVGSLRERIIALFPKCAEL